MLVSAARVLCRGAYCVVLPHSINQGRPYALRHPVLAFASGLILALTLGGSGALFLTPEIARLSTITARTLVRFTNAERAKTRLPSLTENARLQRSAQLKAEHMLRLDYFEHTGPDGLSPWVWFDRTGYDYLYAGENLAIDFTEAEDVVTAWMRSPGHRRNLLADRYKEIGVAVVTGEFQGRTATVVVQHFGAIRGAPAPVAAGSPRVGLAPAIARAATEAESAITLPPTPPETILLPDPRGDPRTALLAVLLPPTAARATSERADSPPVLLTRHGRLATARLPLPTANLTLTLEDGDGREQRVVVEPFLRYATASRGDDSPRARVAAMLFRTRPFLVSLLALLAVLLGANLLAHLRVHRILHADLLLHAVAVLVFGTSLVLFT